MSALAEQITSLRNAERAGTHSWVISTETRERLLATLEGLAAPGGTPLDDAALKDAVGRAICKSRTCEGVSCCQWPANLGRTQCPVDSGGYDDAASAAIKVIRERLPKPPVTP